MPERRISPEENDQYWSRPFCAHPDHNPAMNIVREPGVYEHECPACGKKCLFTVPANTRFTT